MRWAIKQCETSKSVKIDILCFLTIILKCNHFFDLRWSLHFNTNKNISLFFQCCFNAYAAFSFNINVHYFNVFSLKQYIVLMKICSFSIDFSSVTSLLTATFKSKIFEFTLYSNAYNFTHFSNSFSSSCETFNLKILIKYILIKTCKSFMINLITVVIFKFLLHNVKILFEFTIVNRNNCQKVILLFLFLWTH